MDDLESILSNLKLNSDNLSDSEDDVEKYLEEIEIAFKENETTTKWIDELQNEYGMGFDLELNKMPGSLEQEESSEEDTSAIRYKIIKKIAKRCIRLEIKIRQDEFRAEDAIDVIKFIDEHRAYYAQKDYMIGFRYVVNCLAIKGQLKEISNKNGTGQISARGLKDLLKTVNEYQCFGIQPQVGVLALKQYFAGNILKGVCYEFQLKISRSLVEMDPDNLEWRFCLYSILRYKRVAGENARCPSQSEIYVITEAYEQRYAIFDARICLGYAFCLSEIFRNLGKRFVPIKYGEKVFRREADVLECIKTKVEDVLAIDPTSVRSNIDVAKIYSSILPYSYRDTTFAMACIKRALMFHPNSSKANHRMAALLISQNSPLAALEYLQKAVEADEKNLFASVDLLRVYMADISTYKTKIEQILEDPIYKPREHYNEILLLKAVYTYFNGDSQTAVDLLIDAFTNNLTKSVDSLEYLQNNFKRFNWGDYNSFAKDMKAILQDRMTFCEHSEKKILMTIWKSLKEPYDRDKFKSGHNSYSHNSRSTGSGYYQKSREDNRSGYDNGYEEFFKNFRGSGSGKSGDYGSGNKGGNSGGSPSKNVQDYAILGLPQSATKSDIKKRFHQLAKEHHPDKNMHLSEEQLLKKQELMKRINTAYENLASECQS